MSTILLASAGTILALALYVWHNDKRILSIPEPISALNLKPVTALDVLNDLKASKRGLVQQQELEAQLPPKTGRRYIVLGGGGSVGGWVVVQLLQRGENPKSIRVIDLAPTPANIDVQTARERDGLEYVIADMSSSVSINETFTAPWNDGLPSTTGITIFHTAANIRFFERHPIFLSRSTNAIVKGTENILEASKLIGADVLIYTSSIGVYYKYVNMLLWPWQAVPKLMFQRINDDENQRPKTHQEYYSNYNIAKGMADDIVRKWDKTPVKGGKILRTGSLRPGNSIYGPRGGSQPASSEVKFRNTSNPTWSLPIVHTWISNENCALAHLLYERRLLDLQSQTAKGSSTTRRLPDIGGQSFVITDPGPPVSFADAATSLQTLTAGVNKMEHISPTLMLLLSHIIESYTVFQYRVTSIIPFLQAILRPIPVPLAYVQPPAFCGVLSIIIDDSRARLSPEEGGLGYKGAWTTLEGFRRAWQDYNARRQQLAQAKKSD